MVNHSLHSQIMNPEFLKFVISKLVLMKSKVLEKKLQNTNLKDLLRFIGSNKDSQVQELPFWGFKSNAGIHQNIFNYWVEKAFTKSKQQMVSYKKLENVNIEGALALDIILFKDIMKEMSEKLNSYIDFYKLKMKRFPVQYTEINIDQIFYQYYESSQLSLYLNETGKKFWNHFLFYDSLIEQSLEKDEINIQQKYKEIKGYFANIHSININRSGCFSRPVRTIMVFYELEEKEKDKIQQPSTSVKKTKLIKKSVSNVPQQQFLPHQQDQFNTSIQNNYSMNQDLVNSSLHQQTIDSSFISNLQQDILNNIGNANILNLKQQWEGVNIGQNQHILKQIDLIQCSAPQHIDFVKIFDDCNSKDKLNSISGKFKDILPRVNKEFSNQRYKYVLYDRNENSPNNQKIPVKANYYPLLWLQFNDLKQKIVNIQLPEELRICANKVLIKIIDHAQDSNQFINDVKDQTFQEPIQGPGFSFVSFSGELINIKYLNQGVKKKSKSVVLQKSKPKPKQKRLVKQ